ncbi:hypothetical protein HY989_02705 [Candidatus Micrarchaeota archaeon]|nr:hypothetical protein [Candidatus Micrarchaeota archaeon]
MAFDNFTDALPQMLSIAAFFISVVLLFFGLRYFTNSIEDIARLLAYAIPSLWMLGFSIYLWLIGKEDQKQG